MGYFAPNSSVIRPVTGAKGHVALVGSGPGAADLLTLRAVRAIEAADLVLFDELVSDEIRALIPATAETRHVGKRMGLPGLGQSEINRLMADRAHRGQRVVRLKSGDPFVFGRGGEEVDELRQQGVDVEVIPGVTAALGCLAAAGIPLTHRDHASSATFLTGHLARIDGEKIDWQSYANERQTLVIYMGLNAAAEISKGLIGAGRAGDTPVAIIENGTRADQKVSRGTLRHLAAMAEKHRNAGPALIVIGAVTGLAQVTGTANDDEANFSLGRLLVGATW